MVNVGAASVATAASGNQPHAIGLGDHAVSLSNGTTSLANLTISAVCPAGFEVQAGACQRPVLRYSEYALAIDGTIGSYPVKLTGNPAVNNGTEPVINLSQYQQGPGAAIPLYGCFLPEASVMRPDGWLIVQCKATILGGTLKEFMVNPTTNELTDSNEAAPAGMVWHSTVCGTFGDSPYASHGVARNGGYYAKVVDGLLYLTSTDQSAIRFIADADMAAVDWAPLSRVTATSADGFKLLVVYSH